MKNLFLFVLLFFIGTNFNYASHSMGADLTYEHIAGNNYRVTLKFYRDCSGIMAPTNPQVDIGSTGCNTNTFINLNKVGVTILPTSCGTSSSCYGGSLLGAEEHVYQGVVSLPGSCSDWELSWRLCCRNTAITTLQSGGSQFFYIETKIDNTNGQTNNSPQFTALPVIYVGVGQQVVYNHGVTDPDGDQLVFSLVNGLDDANSSVNYVPGLSGTQPLITTGPTTINSATGQITFTPSVAQVGVISVMAEEYRNGIKIGEVTRDMQIIVSPNNNTAPIVSGVNGTANSSGTTGPYGASVQAGSTLCFNLATYDAEGHYVDLTATTPTGATFTSNPWSNSAQFCWTPTASDIGTHFLHVVATDSVCPYPGSNSYAYQINVLGNGNCGGSITATVTNSTVDFQYNGTFAVTHQWTFGDGNSSSSQNPTYTYSTAGTYTVTLTTLGPNNQQCTYTTTVVIHTNGTCDANFTYDSDFFYPNYVSGTATYFWDFGDGTTSTQMQPPNNLGPGTWTVCLNMVNCGDSCVSCQVITIASCDGEISSTAISHFTYQFELINNTHPVTNYLWNFGDGNTSTAPAPVYTYSTAGNYVVSLTTVDSMNNQCVYTDSINVCPSVCDASFTYSNGVLSANAQNNPYYHWYNGNNGAYLGGNPNQQVNYQSGSFLFCLSTTTALGDSCMTCDTVIIGGCQLQIFTTSFDASCGGSCDGSAVASVTCGISPYTYHWSNGQTGQQITGLCAGTYTVTATDAQGTTVVGTVTVSSSSSLAVSVSTTPESTPGANNGTATLAVLGGSPPYVYQWSNGAVNQTISGLSAGSYCVTVTDVNGCSAVACDSVWIAGNCDAGFTYNSGVFVADDINAQNDYFWDFGDGTISTGPVTQHGYNPGTYLACLYVTTPTDSCMACDTIVVQPQAACNADFTHINGVFTATYLNNQFYHWNFGDGTTSNQPIEQHTYSNPGTYIACLSVISPLGDSCMTCDSIYVQNPPPNNCDAGFTYNNGLFAADVISSVNVYNWEFGDGTYGSGPVTQHGYAPGTYLACLYVATPNDSCKTCDTITIQPQANCNADFTYINGVFAANDLTNQFYYWDFGDGTKGSQAIEQHAYAPGTYLACLSVTSALGDSCTTCDTISISNLTNLSGIIHRKPNALADDISVGITGSGQPFAGVTVILEDSNGNQIAKTVTNATGKYEFAGFNYGKYLVKLDVPNIIHKGEHLTFNQSTALQQLNFTVNMKSNFGSPTLGASALLAYPNPTTNEVTLKFNNTLASPTMLLLQNSSGEFVYKREQFVDKGDQFVQMNLERLPAGMYFITIQNENLLIRSKVVKVVE